MASSWQTAFEEALRQRQDGMRRVNDVVACFAQLSVGAERLLDDCNGLRERCQQADLQVQEARHELSLLRRHSVGLGSLASQPPSTATGNTPTSASSPHPMDVKKMAEMEAKFASLKDERSELYKAQSQNTMKLLELSDQLKQRESRIAELMQALEAGKAEQQRYEQRLEDFENLVKEKNFTIQIMQDELTALQLELIKMDEEGAGTEGTGTMLRRVSIGGVPINHTHSQVLVDRTPHLPHLPTILTRIDIYTSDAITAADGLKNMLVFGSGNYLTCRDSDGTEWTVKVNSRVCRVSLALAHTKGIILCGRRDAIVSLISADSHRIRAQLVSPDVRELSDLAVAADGQHIWTLSPNCLKYWHCDRSICLRTVAVADGRCLCVGGGGGGEWVLVGTAGGAIHRLPLDTMSDLKTILQHQQPVLSLASKPGDLIAAAFPDKVVLLQRDRPVQTFTVPGTITAAGFFKDAHLYVVHGDAVTFYGLSGFASERQLCVPKGETVVAVLPDQDLLITDTAIYALTPHTLTN